MVCSELGTRLAGILAAGDSRMARWRWRWLIVSFLVLLLLVWGFDRFVRSLWVGSTDLMVEFVVTDATSSGPVPGARVEVQSQGGFYAEDFEQEFALTADAGGLASKECLRCECYGSDSGLRFTDTFAVYLPYWRYRVVAEGYESTEWANLYALEHARQVQRTGPRHAKLIVPVTLAKSHADPTAADGGGE